MSVMLHEKRFLATIIDAGVGLVLTMLFAFLFDNLLGIEFMDYDYYFQFMFTFVMFLYQFFSILIFKGRTLGLFSMSLVLMSSDWEKVSLRQNILRSVTIAIPILFLVNLLYMFMYKTRNTTLFDNVSDTVVVSTGDNYHVNPENMLEKIKKHVK